MLDTGCMPGDVERKSIVGAALAVGWIVIWAFYLAQVVFPGKLPAADTGATVAATAAWLAFVVTTSSLVDLFRHLLSFRGASFWIRSRSFPVVAFVAGIVFARFAWS
jgi:hypothetical protein